METITTRLSGVTFGDAQENIKRFGCEDIGSYALVREPDNEHDRNAIRVALVGHFFLGYVPADLAKDLAPRIDSGERFLAFFVKLNQSPNHGTLGLTVRISKVDEDAQPQRELVMGVD